MGTLIKALLVFGVLFVGCAGPIESYQEPAGKALTRQLTEKEREDFKAKCLSKKKIGKASIKISLPPR